MLAAKTGDKVQVLIETVGTKDWSKRLGIASRPHPEIPSDGGKLVLEDDSSGDRKTAPRRLLFLILSAGDQNYPADRNLLIFWDHGAGPGLWF